MEVACGSALALATDSGVGFGRGLVVGIGLGLPTAYFLQQSHGLPVLRGYG